MSSHQSWKEALVALLCFEAKRWIGTREEGKNGGQLVQMFQRAGAPSSAAPCILVTLNNG